MRVADSGTARLVLVADSMELRRSLVASAALLSVAGCQGHSRRAGSHAAMPAGSMTHSAPRAVPTSVSSAPRLAPPASVPTPSIPHATLPAQPLSSAPHAVLAAPTFPSPPHSTRPAPATAPPAKRMVRRDDEMAGGSPDESAHLELGLEILDALFDWQPEYAPPRFDGLVDDEESRQGDPEPAFARPECEPQYRWEPGEERWPRPPVSPPRCDEPEGRTPASPSRPEPPAREGRDLN